MDAPQGRWHCKEVSKIFMEYALVKRVSEIVKQDTLNEIQDKKDSFCDKMNAIFSVADLANIKADVSSFFSALKTTASMQAIIPPKIFEGLKKGIYKFNKSDGQYLAQIVNTKDGRIVKNLRLEEVKQLSNPAGMNAISLQIAIQMKLAEIQGMIEDLSIQVNRKLDAIIQSQVDTIIAKSESALIRFEDSKRHPELNIELKEVKSDIDEAISLIKRDIPNRINTIKEIESRKKNWFRKTVSHKDIEDAAKNVSYIQEEIQYLQILFMIKVYTTKDIQDMKDYTHYLNTVFSEECCYMLNTWEYRPEMDKNISLDSFWVNKFQKYLNIINREKNELLALEDNSYEKMRKMRHPHLNREVL